MKLLNQSFVRYGLIMSAITAGCLLLMELTGQNQSFDGKSALQALFMLVAPFVVWWLGIAARKKSLKGKLTYKQGLTEGFKISLVYAIISPFIFLIYYTMVNQHIVEYVREAYRLSDVPDSTVILVDMLAQFIAATVFGTIYAAIISLFLKSK